MYTQSDLNQYIESKQMAWSPSTLKSESLRLRKILGSLSLGPAAVYEQIKRNYKPYALKTLFIRASKFTEFVDGDKLGYGQFIKDNARLFKNAYERVKVDFTYEEALATINSKLADGPEKQAALLMLTTGLRVHEALKYDGSGFVIGKGGKKRPVFSSSRVTGHTDYVKVYRALKQVALKPHDLRKLAATKLAASGEFNEADLMEVFGWSNIQTASNYLQSTKLSQLSDKIRKVLTHE